MTTFDLAIIGSIICGIVMVCGGILLLYKGAIKLEVASKDPALTVELFEKQFKLSTQAPALGLFVIGLLFAGLAIYFTQELAATPIELRGKTDVVDEQVTVVVSSEWSISARQGEVHAVLRPQMDVLWITISAPGYEPYNHSYVKDQAKKGIDFGQVSLRRQLETRIPPKKENIRELPPGVTSPPLTAGGSFGRSMNP